MGAIRAPPSSRWSRIGRTQVRDFPGHLLPDSVKVHPVDHSVPAGDVLVVGEPYAFVQLAFAVPARGTQPHRIHDEDPAAGMAREALDDDHVATRGAGRTE